MGSRHAREGGATTEKLLTEKGGVIAGEASHQRERGTTTGEAAHWRRCAFSGRRSSVLPRCGTRTRQKGKKVTKKEKMNRYLS
jgi:hypothetical protein